MTAQPSPQPHAGGGARAWWQDAVIYHVYLPSFRDADGDGVGDLAGVIEGLPYLHDVLGVDALWISPFFVSPWVDGGYDIADHTAIEPRFGDLATFDRLVGELHRRGMRLVIDYVPNHTSDQHPWFVESRSSRESPKRDWYIWADPRPDGGPPNNWVSEAGGSVWEWDERTGQFYLHSHLVEQPDLNWRNPAVRAAMMDVMRFWLDRGVDGFRIDVVHMLMKDPELRDNPPSPDTTPNPYDRQHPDFTTQLHIHDRRHPDLHTVLRELRALLDSYGDRVAIGELEVMPWKDWAAFYGRSLDELHLPMNFSLIETPWSAGEIATALSSLEEALPPGAWPVNNLGNHDRSRLATRYGEAGARTAAMLLLSARGTPILYYGDEIGMTDVDVPRELMRDGFARHEGGPSRDPNRTPLPWSPAPGAGFSSSPHARTWLPLAPDWPSRNIERQRHDPASMLSLYRRLLSLRRASPALRAGAMRLHPVQETGCVVYERTLDDERMLVALNPGQAHRTVPVGRVELMVSTRAERALTEQASAIELCPGEGVIGRVLA